MFYLIINLNGTLIMKLVVIYDSVWNLLQILCSNALMHLFNCPRLNYAVNTRKQCSRLFVRSDPTDFLASLELR